MSKQPCLQIMGSMMAAFSEGMSLAQKSDLKQEDLLEVLSLGAMNNPLFAMKGNGLIAHNYPPAFPLKHQQKDMRLAMALGEAAALTSDASPCWRYNSAELSNVGSFYEVLEDVTAA